MSNQVQIFNFNANQVRIQIINDKEYFCAKDICDILEIKNNRQALLRVESEDVILTDTPTNSGIQQMSFVNEAGLYSLIFQSKKEEAKNFKKWVFEEVLPTIRKTGKYEVAPQLPQFNSEFLLQLSEAMREKEKLIEKQTQEIQVLEYSKATVEKNLEIKEGEVKEKDAIIQKSAQAFREAARLFKQVADKTGCIKFKACASLLNIRESELKAILKQNKWIYLNKLFPTTDGRTDGYVKLQAEIFDVKLKSGSKVQKSNTAFYITEKGYNEILRQVSGIILN